MPLPDADGHLLGFDTPMTVTIATNPQLPTDSGALGGRLSFVVAGNFLPFDATAVLVVNAAGYQEWKQTITLVPNLPDVQMLPVVPLKPGWPSEVALRNFTGNFCGLLIPGIVGPTVRPGLLFTPGYVCESADNRKRILDAYPYTHFPINLHGGPVYRNYYPDADGSQINTYLTEILNAGKIPVGFVLTDTELSVSTLADPDLVPIAVPRWEDPNPFTQGKASGLGVNTFRIVRDRFPKSIIGWHCPPGQDAPYQGMGWSNGQVWTQMAAWGVSLFLFQGQAWQPNGVANAVANLSDFIVRLKDGRPAGYPVGQVSIVDFEETAYFCMDMQGDVKQAQGWAQQIRSALPKLDGYCSG